MSYLNLENIFTYHPPKNDQASRYELLRNAAKAYASQIHSLAPDSAERTLAVRAVQESVMWANASIAINE